MRTNAKKRAIVAAALGGVLVAGGVGIAAADNSPGPSGNGTATTDKDGTGTEKDENDEATFTGTINAPAEGPEAADGSAEEKAQEKAEDAALAKLATVSKQDATQAATAAVPGKVAKIALDEEDGFVVWEAEITKDDGTKVEALIDAGDGSVLAQEVED